MSPYAPFAVGHAQTPNVAWWVSTKFSVNFQELEDVAHNIKKFIYDLT
jgi:hypothetical protein